MYLAILSKICLDLLLLDATSTKIFPSSEKLKEKEISPFFTLWFGLFTSASWIETDFQPLVAESYPVWLLTLVGLYTERLKD